MKPRKVGEEMRALIARVGRARRELPSDKELARKAGCTPRAVQHIMRIELLRMTEVSASAASGMVAPCQSATEAKS